ncbi:TIGR04219 family outer membrane beta-barrel protein [Salinivibrio costicola]|uniref:Fe3+-hydroxamate ABC transporter substrate-binding protein n=1 Tax=Salinivibrio costicola subsp. alcaliphilus TaxID=272773 RepID=A0ABX3KU86_SALCS|nr:TIGR04219 family outer membrane beta-barrel protein [Salinivibrio costicola]OOF34542.1 Fe3+-hydroxamate ABC transporter substrate-binding protein [Salinivibrio costicola subsp. alcaliphilus]
MKTTSMTLAAAAFTALLAMPSQAATLAGGKVGADAWFMDADVNNVEADDASTAGSYYAALEHPLPLIPNAKIRQTSVSVDGTRSDNVDFDQIDFVAYYEFLDNDLVSVDAGVNLQRFQSGKFKGESFDEWQPNLYVDARVGLVGTPLNVFATVSKGEFDGTSTLDAEAGLIYQLGLVAADLNVRGGYRMIDHDFDYFNNKAELDLTGFFVGAELDF